MLQDTAIKVWYEDSYRVHRSEIQPADIMCSKSKQAKKHPGNIRFVSMVQKYRKEYQETTIRMIKARVTREILSLVTSAGGRFLRTVEDDRGDEEIWEVLKFEPAYEKVSHALRSAKERKCGRRPKSAELSMNSLPNNETDQVPASLQPAGANWTKDNHVCAAPTETNVNVVEEKLPKNSPIPQLLTPQMLMIHPNRWLSTLAPTMIVPPTFHAVLGSQGKQKILVLPSTTGTPTFTIPSQIIHMSNSLYGSAPSVYIEQSPYARAPNVFGATLSMAPRTYVSCPVPIQPIFFGGGIKQRICGGK